ncbi:hypothetical protein PICSAR240_03187 [Mycobacterium avium subsp. paratuberculosis]|nr:hypothetical protein PICSAR120_02995 [Mycobacterium avium subsp. paratuberculosis]CAG6913653.1 hypothetical protein PICSAR113_03342 [Mycobacterium avium subsp. paratuberculosis]CAG6914060.1 hypothetical protein PICSAR111_03358 [Mycobacterium avium subsp. paratuberculosis]CAG6919082.1 hypothetical protein PICSAR124B_03663 [Mycobacterium avium subsp. paratuberculosis]CAG6919602.1 hypothetical protein PICSAR10_03542 [Mycobacterium avium subsp. paratuberculosis]
MPSCTVEKIPTVGLIGLMPCNSAENSPSSGSICEVCPAPLVCSLRAKRPSASARATIASICSGGPPMTVWLGAAYTHTSRPGKSANTVLSSSAEYSTRAMNRMYSPNSIASPSPIRCEREQITRVASASESPPEKYADAGSPSDWPTTAAGLAPWWRSSSPSAIWIAKMTTLEVSMPYSCESSRISSSTE